MTTISFARHQFPPDIIRHAVWLYLRFTLSFRDVEDLLAERGLDVSYETIRRWVLKFGPLFARELRRRRHRPTSQWHLDEMAILIGGRLRVESKDGIFSADLMLAGACARRDAADKPPIIGLVAASEFS